MRALAERSSGEIRCSWSNNAIWKDPGAPAVSAALSAARPKKAKADADADTGSASWERNAAVITLADIVEAVEGPIALTACVEEGRADCTLEDACAVRPHWPLVSAALLATFARALKSPAA
jgi:hypothetical protein